MTQSILGSSFLELLVGQAESHISLAVRAGQRSCREKHMVQPPPDSGSPCEDTEVGFRYHNGKSMGSVLFSHLVVSDPLQPHEPQNARPPCPSPIPGVHPNPCPLSQWCHPTISSSVVLFSSCLQSFPASGSFPMSQLFTSGGQNIGVSASILVLPMNTQDWSPLGWIGWISLQSKGLSRVFSNTTVKIKLKKKKKHQFFGAQLSLQSNSHIHTWPLEKPQLWLDGPLLAK